MTLTPASLPPGWSPYADGHWPPDGSTIDVIDRDGVVSTGLRYRHWDLIEVMPLGWRLQRHVVGWRLHEPKK